MGEPPNRAYYRACVGRWACPLDFAIVDEEKLRAAPLSSADRARIRMAVTQARVFGQPRFETSVAMEDDHRVVHTTRVSQLGVPLLVGREVITLDQDGRSFTMNAIERTFPFFAPHEQVASGQIDESGTRATYHLMLFGVPLLQTTIRDGDVVTITQETEFSRGVQRLERQR